MRFVDLFCGIGGFHAALSELGHKCVFACDSNKKAADVYERNFGISAYKDIRDCKELPEFDILCAGFPCQPFSKSGSQEGFRDKTRGTLFHEILRIIKQYRPSILLLENVPNLKSHDSGNTFEVIRQSIENEGYSFSSDILSPHSFGTPQIRKRLYMVGVREDLCKNEDFQFPKGSGRKTSVRTILDKKSEVSEKYYLTNEEIEILEHWNEFIQKIPTNINPSSPTWSQEFNRSYPLDNIHPITKQWRVKVSELKNILASECIPVPDSRFRRDVISLFPPYIISAKKPLPEWKKRFIRNNREKWQTISKDLGDSWLVKTRTFEQTYQKIEWQVGDGERNVWKHLIQIRPSGIRVKKTDYIPALVAIAQIPIIGWQKRRMTPKECARAQDFDVDGIKGDNFTLDLDVPRSYKQLGNAVNVKVTREIMSAIQEYIGEINDE